MSEDQAPLLGSKEFACLLDRRSSSIKPSQRSPSCGVLGPWLSHRCSLLVAEYVDFLNSVTPDNQDEFLLQMRRFNLGPVGEADCPVFDGMFEYCAVGFP